MMYDLKKTLDEDIISIIDDSILKFEGKSREISIILTNKRIVFLDYPSAINNYEETMRISRGINYLRKKEPFFELEIKDLKSIEKGDFDKYQLKNGNYFFLESEKLRNELQRNFNII